MKSLSFFVGEIVSLIVGHELENRPVWQRRRFVEKQPPFFDARSQRAHPATVRLWVSARKRTGFRDCPLEGSPVTQNR